MNKEDDESVGEGLVNIRVQEKGTPSLLLRQDSKSKVQWIQNSKERTEGNQEKAWVLLLALCDLTLCP